MQRTQQGGTVAMIKSTKNNDMKSYAEKLKVYTYYSYISLITWIISGVILAVLLITDIKLPIISLMVLLVSCGIDLYFSHKKKQLGVEEGITQAFLVNDDTGEKIKINMLKIDKMEKLLNFLGIEFTESTVEN